jgi:hypothetical protein
MHWAAVEDDEIDGTGSKEPIGEPVAVVAACEVVIVPKEVDVEVLVDDADVEADEGQ